MRIDFTNCPSSNINYSGSEKKVGVVFAGANWMLKFRKNTVYGYAFNDVAEHLGSKIFSFLGFNAQETLLGIYDGECVVACKDFMFDKKFTPFNDVGESSLDADKNKYTYSYNDIKTLIDKNKKIVDKNEIMNLFWDTYVVDCLLANDDRHGRNWGFIKKDNKYYPAPIFDNGNSLFALFADEEEMEYVLNNLEEMKERVYETPRSVMKNDNGLNDYYSVISSKTYLECNNAILKMVPIIKANLPKIYALIESVDLSDIRKLFLKSIIKMRFELILLKTYEELVNEYESNRN